MASSLIPMPVSTARIRTEAMPSGAVPMSTNIYAPLAGELDAVADQIEQDLLRACLSA